jgi:SAM-dependent methyltransferase
VGTGDEGDGGGSSRRARRPERRTSSQRFAPYARGDAYDERWSQLAGAGHDVHGEANFVESVLRDHGGRRVLDAGCGTGRVGIELAARGFEVVGVDIDPTMLDTARRKAPAMEWLLADLATLALGRVFDAVVLAGNVMIYVGAGNEPEVLQRVAAHLPRDGLLVAGFQLDSGRYTLDAYDRDAAGAGFELRDRYATWERDPYAGGGYAVSVHIRR